MTPDTKLISLSASAKINLYLHVIKHRQDGYHELDSLVTFAGIHDNIHLTPTTDLKLFLTGPYRNDLGLENNNLVIKAAIALREKTGVNLGANIVLEKNLPVASGIGGGSADCAAVLKGLVQLWKIDINISDLNQLCLQLGSDIPVCYHGQTAFMSGRGEIINNAPTLPSCWLVLVNPGFSLSTRAVFKARQKILKKNYSQSGQFLVSPKTTNQLASLLKERSNDLTEAAISLQPEISEVLKALRNTDSVLLTRMSGSGATCFGVYDNFSSAKLAAKNISFNYPNWWVRPTPIAEKKEAVNKKNY
jgi:4-diphosphocytidyl-2-C-methyl-D-erythritol kinase